MPFISAIIGAIGAVATAVGSFVAPLASALGGLGLFGRAALSIGLNLAMSAVQGLFAKKTAPPPSGVDLDLQFGEGGSRKVMCGRFAVAGHFNHANAYGTANGTLQQVFTLSDFPVTSLDRIWIDGELATLGAEDATKGFVVTSGDYAGKIWIKLIDGWQTGADSGLVAGSNPAGRWGNNHIGLGIAYVIATLAYDREKLTQPPQFLFECKGAPLYDWRKDTTAGGSGAHRWDDITTWEFTENPMLMAYAYHRGVAFNGDLFCGMEVAAIDLPIARWTAAANICDETVGGARRYRCSIGLDCNAPHGDNIEAIMTACGGLLVTSIGEIYVVIGTGQTVVATLTDDDLIDGQPVSYQRRRSMDALVNSVSGTFPNPDNIWGPTSYETARDTGIVTADRRSRDVSINFGTVPYAEQAGQLASIYFSENRFEATATITVRPRWQVLEVSDWITWNSARYGSRTFMVTDMQIMADSDDGPRNTVLSLQERSGDIYDSVTVTVPPAPLGPATPVYAAELQDFTVTAATGAGADSRIYPIIRAAWSAPTDPTVSGAVIEWRAAAQPAVVMDRTVTSDRTVAILADGIVSVTEYQVRHKLLTDPPRPTVWGAWKDVTTLDAPTNDVAVGLDQVRDDVASTLTDMRSEIERVKAQIIDVGYSVQLGGVANYQTVSRVMQRAGNAEAQIVVEQDVRASGDEALAAQLTSLSATVGSNASAISSETITRASADDALAGDIISLSATVGSNTSAISSESVTRASADDALAADINSLTATVGSNASAISSETITRASADDALAADITSLSATVGSNTSAISSESVTRASADDALAADLVLVEAQADSATAAGLIKWEASAGPGGSVLARFTVFGRATAGGTYRDGGAVLDVTATGASWSFFSDQFNILKPDGTPIAVFGLDGSDLLLQNIRVGTVVFDQLSSANGKLIIKGSGTNASIEVFS
ncbi:MAG: phage tail protein [Hoeflea sp.]|uniref:phage tail protein n=1 Tax=Hoeflea sp. TaxID=1940281 RepID=UPI003EF1E01E